jgi:hypothetical protein
MSRPKANFSWPKFERVTEITMSGAEIASIRLLEDDCIVPDPAACRRYSFSGSHLDRMHARGEAPPAIRVGARLKGRWASSWYAWELGREIRRPRPALPPVVPELPEPPRRTPRGRGRPRKTTTAPTTPPPAE